jgi:amino acid transporter
MSDPIVTEERDFPGWGTAERIEDLHQPAVRIHRLDSSAPHKLGEWKATALCGNDITSSCLYVAALCTISAGIYAPLALLLVGAVLYLFRDIYAEVGSALPLNGGAYNVLLNTTTKAKASMAACLTILSYLATAVISAYEAMHYAHNLWSTIDVPKATIAILGLFALLSLIGIGESAAVALALFVFHIGTLSLLTLASAWAVASHPAILLANWATAPSGGFGQALFFGFSSAMLGISGFESSANFIEEQKPGVFPKTLRNMWIAIVVFNPIICLLAQGLLPLSAVQMHQEDLLAQMGLLSSGTWLQKVVSIDAVLVLSGAVLTGYVGVTGLIRRMSLDRCLPQFLLQKNKRRGTNHWIILLFFLLCCSIFTITGGQVRVLAGVYTLSFLGVMALFAVGNMLLKVERARLRRSVRASWPAALTALAAVLIALTGNILMAPYDLEIFGLYFLVAAAVVMLMLTRVQLLRAALAVTHVVVDNARDADGRMTGRIRKAIQRIIGFHVVYFTKGDDLAALNRAAVYVLGNELTNRLKVVHCYEREADIAADLAEQLRIIDRIYPSIRIDLVLVHGRFGPELIERVSRRLRVPKNYMFIGTPGDRFPHNIAELGGVRLIM